MQIKKCVSIIISFCLLFTLFPMYTPANNEYFIASDSNAISNAENSEEIHKEFKDEKLDISTSSNAENSEEIHKDLNNEELEVSTSSNAKEIKYYNQTLFYDNIFISGYLPDGIDLEVNDVDVDYLSNYIDIVGLISSYEINLFYDDDYYKFDSDLEVELNLEECYEYIDVYYLSDGELYFLDSDLSFDTIFFDLPSNGVIILKDPSFVTYNLMSLSNNIEYIYLDLAAGNISIDSSSYSGYVYINGVKTAVSGSHSDDNQYYIYQSNVGNASILYDLNGVPIYQELTYNGMSWGDYIMNHPSRSSKGADSVDEVIVAWGSVAPGATTVSSGVAKNAGRVPTPNYINISASNNDEFNIIIDNLWSSKQSSSSHAGGITYIPEGIENTLNLYLVGDNRFGNMHCSTHDGRNAVYDVDINHTNEMTISTLSGENDATLTVCNVQENSKLNAADSVIGGSDYWDHSVKMIFNSGIVYAGSSYLDFCTAIGGGGNGDGRVIIDGGIITAVNSSTGTAIGGGCGTSGPGGYGEVIINDGEVYAYSYAVNYALSDNATTKFNYGNALPTAIGGGSSGTQIGGHGIVEINGGKVYAYSETGNAIGGGGGGYGVNGSSYYSTTGGIADITITDGEIYAISDGGCSIGGGPGGGRSYDSYYNTNSKLPNDVLNSNSTKVTSNGGDAQLEITGGVIYTGSIGGGSPQFHDGSDENKYGFTIGAAQVYISGGKLHGQVVMEGDGSLFEMNDGLIDNTFIGSEYKFVKNDGGAVYIKTGNAYMNGGEIINCEAKNGGAMFVSGGNFEMSGGVISLNTSLENGGAVYVNGGNVNITGGLIDNNFSEKSGGGIYVSSDNNDFTVDILSGSIINNYSGENGGGIGIDVDSNSNVEITIGLEPCLGLDEHHSHPVIEDNIAQTQGGGFYLNGDESNITLDMYCGNINDNFSNYERSSDNVSQIGGLFNWYSGSIGYGLCVTGGTLLDERVNTLDIESNITYNPNYVGASDSEKLALVTNGVEICLPAYAFVRDGYYLLGWSEKAVPDSNKDIILIGTNYSVYSDKTLYAIWTDVPPSVNYIVYIPDKVNIDESKKEEFEISVEMSYFPYDSTLSLYVDRGNLLRDESGVGLSYDLLDGDKSILSGDLITTWSLRNRDSKNLILEVLDDYEYAGNYSDILTFRLDYKE